MMKFRVAGTALALGCIVLFTSASVGVAVTDASAPRSTHAEPQSSCVGWCFVCDVWENKFNVIPSDVTPNDTDDNVQCGHHTPCSYECRISSNETAERVVGAVANNDVKRLRRLLHSVPGLKYNEERQALQLDGCQAGTIVLHVPLTQRQVAAVTTELQSPVVAQR